MTDPEGELNIDVTDFTLGEVELIEDISGQTVSAIAGGSGISAKAMTAMVYVHLKRTDPEVTLDDVRAMRLSTVEFGGPDPNGQGDAPSGTARSRRSPARSAAPRSN